MGLNTPAGARSACTCPPGSHWLPTAAVATHGTRPGGGSCCTAECGVLGFETPRLLKHSTVHLQQGTDPRISACKCRGRGSRGSRGSMHRWRSLPPPAQTRGRPVTPPAFHTQLRYSLRRGISCNSGGPRVQFSHAPRSLGRYPPLCSIAAAKRCNPSGLADQSENRDGGGERPQHLAPAVCAAGHRRRRCRRCGCRIHSQAAGAGLAARQPGQQ